MGQVLTTFKTMNELNLVVVLGKATPVGRALDGLSVAALGADRSFEEPCAPREKTPPTTTA